MPAAFRDFLTLLGEGPGPGASPPAPAAGVSGD